MSERKLSQADLEQIGAYLDDELDRAQRQRTAERIGTDPAWAAALAEQEALAGMLDRWPAPTLRRDLTVGVKARLRRKRRPAIWLRAAAPLAAEAAIVVAVCLFHALTPSTTPTGPIALQPTPADAPIDAMIADLPTADRFVVENLDVWADYDVLTHFATLEALEAVGQKLGDG